MKIYTRTGDDGTTGLFGGDRVRKNHPRIEAYGAVDETNAALGLARSLLPDGPARERAASLIEELQSDLFVLGGDLASPGEQKYPVPRIGEEHVARMEEVIDDLEQDLPALKHFILPGGSPAGAALHTARTTCRRAERRMLDLAEQEQVSVACLHFVNRLSDLLFVAARWLNHTIGVPEQQWRPVDRKSPPPSPSHE